MNTMVVAAFGSKGRAFEGYEALNTLNDNGDITIYAAAILTKEINGEVKVDQEADSDPMGTAVGMLVGALLGMLGGAVGVAAGAAAGATVVGSATAIGAGTGGLTGVLYDVDRAGVDTDFVDEVAEVMLPGTTVLIAELDEYGFFLVDTAIAELDGMVYRRPRQEAVEDQLARESAIYKAEMEELDQEIKDTSTKSKAAIQRTTTSIKNRLMNISNEAQERLDRINQEANEKVQKLQSQLKKASGQRKEKIQKRIAEINADQKERSDKLKSAIQDAKEAMKPKKREHSYS